MKLSVFLLFYIFLSLTTLTLRAQSSTTEVIAEKSKVVSETSRVHSKKSRHKTCIRVSQNSNNLQQGQEIVITVKGCKNFEIHKVLVSGIPAIINDEGIAKLSRPSGMIGTHNIPVSIMFKDKNGNLETESYTIAYKVGKAPYQ